MAIKIMGKKIVLEEIVEEDKEEVTAGGIIIPGSVQKPRTILKGKCITHGINCDIVKEGDIIYFDINSAAEIMLEGQSYVIVDESSIFAVGD